MGQATVALLTHHLFHLPHPSSPRCGVPAFRKAAYSFAQAACSEGPLDSSVRTTRAAASNRPPVGPAATMPQLVQSAMEDDEAEPPDSLPDGLFGAGWQQGGTTMLPPPLAAGGWTRQKEQQQQQQQQQPAACGGVSGGSGTAAATGSVTPPPPPPPAASGKTISGTGGAAKKRGTPSGPFCASQTEYVAIPRQPGPPPSAPPSGRTRRQQGLCTYTNLDASQAPRDALDEASQQQQGPLVGQGQPLVEGEADEVVLVDDAVRGGHILDLDTLGAAPKSYGGAVEDVDMGEYPEVDDGLNDQDGAAAMDGLPELCDGQDDHGMNTEEGPLVAEPVGGKERRSTFPDGEEGVCGKALPPPPPPPPLLQQLLPMAPPPAMPPAGARSHLHPAGSSEIAAEPPPPPSLAAPAPGAASNSQCPWSGLEVESTQQLYSELQASRGRAGKQRLPLLLVPPHAAARAEVLPLQQQQQSPTVAVAVAVAMAGQAVHTRQLKRGLEGRIGDGDDGGSGGGGGGDAGEESNDVPPGAKRRAFGSLAWLASVVGGGDRALVAGGGGGGRTHHAAGQLLMDLQGLAACPAPFWDDMEVRKLMPLCCLTRCPSLLQLLQLLLSTHPPGS